MDYQLEGKVKLISDAQTFNSGFTKREFVVTAEDGKYPQDIKFECIKEKCELLDKFSEGDEVNVHFNIRGNEYNGRHFVNLQAWKIDKGGAAPAVDSGNGAPSSMDEPPPGHGQEGDDIPF